MNGNISQVGSRDAGVPERTALDEFTIRAQAVGAQVEHAATMADALQVIVGILREEEVSDAPDAYVVCAECSMLDAAAQRELSAAVSGLRFDVTRETAARAKVGISQMDWALANTGTLAQAADAVEDRLVSTLPRTHIALVSTASLLPDLPSLLNRIDAAKMMYIAFITGPSRTADIERVLTIGVHGPARLVIVMVDDAEAEA